jgi:hypothetical protein
VCREERGCTEVCRKVRQFSCRYFTTLLRIVRYGGFDTVLALIAAIPNSK